MVKSLIPLIRSWPIKQRDSTLAFLHRDRVTQRLDGNNDESDCISREIPEHADSNP